MDQLNLAQVNLSNLQSHSNSRRFSPRPAAPTMPSRPPFNPSIPSLPNSFSPSILGKPQPTSSQKWPSRTNSNRPQCQICGKFGHTALICHHRTNLAYQTPPPQALLTTTSASQLISDSVSTFSQESYHPDENWFLDSGAMHQMTPDASTISNPMPYLGDEHVTVGDGKKIAISHIGCRFVPSLSNTPVFLDYVLSPPAISKKLISVARLCKDNRAFIEFYSSFFLSRIFKPNRYFSRARLRMVYTVCPLSLLFLVSLPALCPRLRLLSFWLLFLLQIGTSLWVI